MVTVKRIAGGLFSNWVDDNLKAGDTIDVMAPHGSFTSDSMPAAKRHYVGFRRRLRDHAGHVADEDRAARASRTAASPCFYGNRDSSSVIFLEELADLKDRYLGRLELHHFLAEEEQDIDLFNGMLDRERAATRRSSAGRRPGRASTPGSSAAPAR